MLKSSTVLRIILIFMIGGLIYSIINVIPQAVVSYENISTLKKNINEKTAQKKTLEAVAPHVQSDDFLELEAKRKLNYKNPDEKVIIFKKEEVGSPFQSETDKPATKPSLLARIYNIFFD